MNTMAVNLNGPYFLMRLVLPDFLARRRGCIINMASRAGTTTGPLLIDYHTSKTALIRLTACVQAEVDLHKVEDVHLYSLHPGAVVSDMSKGTYRHSRSHIIHLHHLLTHRYLTSCRRGHTPRS